MISSLTIIAFEVRDLTLSSPLSSPILRSEVARSLSIMTGMGGGLYPSEITKANTAMFSFAQPMSRHRHSLNGDS